MSAATEPVQPGQRWRRKSDGILTEVSSVDPPFRFRRSVHHRAQRRTITEFRSFLKKYELVSDTTPTGTSAQDDDTHAQQEKNTTREGILVRRDQIWEDLDTRQSKRRVVIESVADGEARVREHYGTKHSTLSVSRMHRHSTGFRLVGPGELKYGAPTASADKKTESR
ncbi:hypothetical protein [Streptomyces acidiscabies]|uniref:Uncharacterized protein n=1 Tax=Streptomyces acidiscabies TaxID=42234 RepID=A0ABU4LYM6_9ACTN|nr:hypothetical protein [Streptomyces acidiscabies]MDX3020063.1 hypothetical protein [Streptomyces acidiscabies]